MSIYYHGQGIYQTAIELAEQLLVLAQRQRDTTLTLDAHAALGLTLFTVAEFERAREHLEQDLAAHWLQQGSALSYPPTIGTEPGVSCLAFAGPTLWMLGYPDRARQCTAESLRRAEALAHPFTRALALCWAAVLSQLRRQVQSTRDMAEAALALTSEQGFVYWEALASCWHGWSLAAQGQAEQGIARLRQGMDFIQAIGIRQCRTWFLGLLAETHHQRGASDIGLDLVEQGIALAAEINEGFYEAELHRLKGEMLLDVMAENGPAAELCFHRALAIAQHQQAKAWELRAATSLA
jgi:predicted ATPase